MGVLKVLAYSHRYLPVDGCKYSRFLFSVNAKVALSAETSTSLRGDECFSPRWEKFWDISMVEVSLPTYFVGNAVSR